MDRTSIKLSGKSLMVPPGISLKPVITAELPISSGDVAVLEPGELALAMFRVEYSATSSRYEIAAFGLDRLDLPLDVTGALLRTVRVHSIVRSAIGMALPLWTRPIQDLRRSGTLSAADVPGFDRTGDDGLLLTAIVYRIAEISNENPALAVAETLGLKQRTATNWIQRARAAGYMTTTDHERAGRQIAALIDPVVAPPSTSPEEVAKRIDEMRKAHGHS